MWIGCGRVVVLWVLVMLLSAANHAWAADRSGFTGGVAAGGGKMFGRGGHEKGGLAAGLHLGWRFNDQIAIVLTTSFVSRVEEPDGYLFSWVQGAAIQYWVSNRVWVKGGVGQGTLENDRPESCFCHRHEIGLGFTAGAGYEVLQATNLVLDLQARVATASFEGGQATNLSVLLGFNWY